jgi:preprotein translocase subunit SecD
VRSVAALDNDDVESASVFVNELDGAPQVSIVFTPTGANDFTMLTRRLVQRRLAIVLDDRLASAPLVMEEIAGGRAVITLGRDRSLTALEAEANALAVALDVGPPLGCRWEMQRLE